MGTKGRVLLAASGGVDSSMSAKKLLEQGYDVVAVYAKMHSFDSKHKDNLANIERISNYLKIDFLELDFKDIFEESVVKPFADSYLSGLTPNPCAMCNRNIKFGELAKYALKNGFDFLATGHYAKTDGYFIYEARDKTKDQSYFLYGITPDILPHLIFPLQDVVKTELKQEAAQIPAFANLSTQKESSEICFVQESYLEILTQRGANVSQVGDVLDIDGNIIGTHKGYLQYTIGQRKGFDAPKLQTPHYVVGIDPSKNQITVAQREHLGNLNFELRDENWFEKRQNASVKIRHQGTKIDCQINGSSVALSEPAFAITKGQAAVFYDGEKVLGGGLIA